MERPLPLAPAAREALVATAIGLFAAIPAVVAYNRFARDIDRIANAMIANFTLIPAFASIEGLVRDLADAASADLVVIGSGPAGLAVAQQLTRGGHTVVVYERADAMGGLLRYGIPEFKMEKSVLDRRLKQMRLEGTIFKAGVNIGVDITGERTVRFRLKGAYSPFVQEPFTTHTMGHFLPV